MAPAGQLWTTVEDLAKWAAFLGGDTGDVLARDTLDEMLEPHVVGDNPGQPWTAAHGLGWQVWNIEGRRLAGHGGSMPGFLAGLRVDLSSQATDWWPSRTPRPDRSARRSPRCSPSSWSASRRRGTLARGGRPSRPGARRHVALGPGRDGGQGRRRAPRPRRAGRGAWRTVRRVGPDEWVGLDGYYTGEPLRIIRRGDGTVSHLDLASFRFTRTPYDPQADVPGGVDEAGWT